MPNVLTEKELSSPADEKKSGNKKLLIIILASLLLILLLAAGIFLGCFHTFTEKRAPFPALPGVNALEQARLMMKVVRILQRTAEKGRPYPKNLLITFTPKELETVTKIISGFGVQEKEWGKLFFQVTFLPEKKAFRGKGILHIDKPFLRERQIIMDMIFQLKLKEGEPEIKVLTLSIGRKSFSGPFPKLEEKLKDSIRSALAKKDAHKFIDSFHIGEKGEGELTISLDKFLSGPGKMLLYL